MAVQLLVDVAQVCQTQRCQDILDIIKKVSERFIIVLIPKGHKVDITYRGVFHKAKKTLRKC